jgi:alkylhydroperoxidase/carboxymuconolactone decarboxylase family protein YurZ
MLEHLKNWDERIYEHVKEAERLALSGGKIPVKYKLLIALAIDASKGAVDGVKALIKAAKENGATKEEIAEALRIAIYICGASAAYTAANALKDIS